MIEIRITGTSGVGKSLYAEGLEAQAKLAGFEKVALSDHHLFTGDRGFATSLQTVQEDHKNWGAELSILVINDGSRTLTVQFMNRVSFQNGLKLFPGLLPKLEAIEGNKTHS